MRFLPQSSPAIPTEIRTNDITRVGRLSILLGFARNKFEGIFADGQIRAEHAATVLPAIGAIADCLFACG